MPGLGAYGVIYGYRSYPGRDGQVQVSPNRSKSEQNRTNRTDHPNRPTGPELLQEVVEGLAERLFVGHAAVNDVAVADYVYCSY